MALMGDLSRRDFFKLGACIAGIAAGSIVWDVRVNGGHPADVTEESVESADDDEDP